MIEIGNVYKPTEQDLLKYFIHLKNEGNASSTMFSKYAMLNSVMQAKFSIRLQNCYPKVIQILNRFKSGYKRKIAKAFTCNDIYQFYHNTQNLVTVYWIVRKCFLAVAITGALRCEEARNLKVSDVVECENGYKKPK